MMGSEMAVLDVATVQFMRLMTGRALTSKSVSLYNSFTSGNILTSMQSGPLPLISAQKLLEHILGFKCPAAEQAIPDPLCNKALASQ
jgi:hypothetical protein